MEGLKSKEDRTPIVLSNIDWTPVLYAIIAVLVTLVVFFFIKKRSASRKNFLITGLCDAGKTVVFTQLLHSKASETFTSIAENVGDYQFGGGHVRVVDIPGSERVRGKYFDQYKNTAKGIIFVIDSVTLQKDIRDVADYLYTILTDSAVSPCSILILCNKQDETIAKGAAVIKSLLEKEINLVRTTRASQLQSVDDSENRTVFLGKPGKDFEFSHLSQNIQILEGSAKNNELSHLTDWLDRML